ncbi:hypothetical protein MBLNU230_g1502t1 [Neophaeotheca triangularis]
MLSTLPAWPSSSPPLPHQPLVSSPLSPRSANPHGRNRFTMTSHSSPSDKTTTNAQPIFHFQNQQPKTPFSQRPIKKHSSNLNTSALKDKRRNLFLQNVKARGDDKRFESRGVDIMRLDFLQRQKQWEAEQARQAPTLKAEDVDEEEDEAMGEDTDELPSLSQMWIGSQREEDRAEEIARLEREELDALLDLMPRAREGQGDGNMWSDDVEDEYDGVFEELLKTDEAGRAQEGDVQRDQQGAREGDEAMDMS